MVAEGGFLFYCNLQITNYRAIQSVVAEGEFLFYCNLQISKERVIVCGRRGWVYSRAGFFSIVTYKSQRICSNSPLSFVICKLQYKRNGRPRRPHTSLWGRQGSCAWGQLTFETVKILILKKRGSNQNKGVHLE